MRARHCLVALVLPALLIGVTACGDDDDGGGGGAFGGGEGAAGDLETIAGSLASLPDNGEDQTIVWGDLARAAEIAGLDRPTYPADEQAMVDYLMTVTGTRSEETDTGTPVAVMPPEAAHAESAADQTAFVDDVGWSLLQVDRFVERQSPPDSITVLDGDFDEDALTDALGEPTDGVWEAGSGEPGEVDVAGSTPARPLGESLWLALAGDGGPLTVTRDPGTSAEVGDALAGDADGVLDDDVSLAALATALDDQSAYGALLLRPGINGVSALGQSVSPEQAEQLCDQLLPQPTAAVATGVTADDDGPVILIALAHVSAEAASANADALEEMVTNGSSILSNEPWSERLELDGVETTGHDLVVVARLRPVERIGTRLWYDIVMRRDNLVTAC
jgi:hypothetical protein